MKATNHPSDKMTIKNNNGDLLLEIDAEGVQSIKFKDGNEITGEDISSAIDKADTLPAVTEADAGKALVVSNEGDLVISEISVPEITAPQAFDTALTTAIQSLATALMVDTKLHKTTFSFDDNDSDFIDMFNFYYDMPYKRVTCACIGSVYVERMLDGSRNKSALKNYLIIPGLGFGEIIILLYTTVEDEVITAINCDVYARRIEQAT